MIGRALLMPVPLYTRRLKGPIRTGALPHLPVIVTHPSLFMRRWHRKSPRALFSLNTLITLHQVAEEYPGRQTRPGADL